jgi:hypothetical protein
VSPHHRRTFRRIRGILEGDQLAFELVEEAIADDVPGLDEPSVQAAIREA